MDQKNTLIADSGSTKTDWCLLGPGKPIRMETQGISPYFQTSLQMEKILQDELYARLGKKINIDEIFYYGTGCANPSNVALIKKAFLTLFPQASITINHDLMGAARSLCGSQKGITCILGTGSNSCYYNGKKVVKNNPGLGFILGDEGSGAFFGKEVLRYYFYSTFDGDLLSRFEEKFPWSKDQILDHIYKMPLPNRYLASFACFLQENRGHFMVENIIEDGLNEFFLNHIFKYRESWKVPIHFVGTIAWLFRDVLTEICQGYALELGQVRRKPMDGLIKFHQLNH
ncbi:MAG: N-acetylglucosamine kinase [Chitinophagaceae bacterium]